jgi:hypothetical protein
LPTAQKEPKEFLKTQTNEKYNQSDNPRIFAKLDPTKIQAQCDYFAKLIEAITKLISS